MSMNYFVGRRQVLSFVLVLAMVLGSLGGFAAAEPVYASCQNDAKGALLRGLDYYLIDRDATIDNWEELVAIEAALRLTGQDAGLKGWKLPATPKADGSVKSYLPAIATSLIRGNEISLLVEELLLKAKDSKFSDHSDIQAYGMLAIDMAKRNGASIPVAYSPELAAMHLAQLQKEDGGFTGEWDNGITTVDTTGIIALALAPYKDEEEIYNSIRELVSFLENMQLENGGFNYEYAASEWGPGGSYESANSTAMAVWGLSAIRAAIDDVPLGIRIDGIISDALPALLKWQNDDGSFGFSPVGQGEFDNMTSRQIMIALYMIADGSDIFYDIEKRPLKLLDIHVRIESDVHYPVSVDISPESGDSILSAVSIAWERAGMTEGFDPDEYKFYECGREEAPEAEITEETNDIFVIKDDITIRSTFLEQSVSGKMNEAMTVTLIDRISGHPLQGVPVTVDGSFVGYDFNMNPLTTGEDGKIIIPPEIFLKAGKYLVSISSSGVSKDVCEVIIDKGEKAKKYVSVRVEGIDKNILFNNQADIETQGEKTLTAYDAIVKALTDKGIDFIIDGGYIASIDGIDDNYFKLEGYDYDYWNFYINGQYSDFGINSCVIENGDEILLYYGNYYTTPVEIDYEISEDSSELKVGVTSQVFNYGTGEYESIVISGVSVTIIGEELNETKITGDDGIVKFDITTTGSFRLQAIKYDETVSVGGLHLPKTVRLVPDYTINLPEEVRVGSSGEVIDVSDGTDTPRKIVGAPGIKDTVLKVSLDPPAKLPQIKAITADNIELDIPKDTAVSAVSGWDGEISLPEQVSVSLSGKTVAKALFVGSEDYDISFSKPVRLLIPGAGDKKVGFIDSKNNFAEIETALAYDDGDRVDNLLRSLGESSGKYVSGSDMVIWTKHFSTFVAYTDGEPTGSGGETNKKNNITLQVIGHDGKKTYNIFNASPVEIENGDTAYSILAKAGLSVLVESGYVSSINGLKERDHGPYSGWKYSVNGSYPSHAASNYRLKDGDKLIWRFVLEPGEGEELGGKDPNTSDQLTEKTAIDAATSKYSDVKPDDWFAQAVGYLTLKNIVSGKGGKSFMPSDNLTRAELVMIVARMVGADLEAFEGTDFIDVDIADWYGQAVAWAEEMGIISGYANKDGSSSFKPDENISRQDIALILYNYNEKVVKNDYGEIGEVEFSDNKSIEGYAKSAVASMQKTGIISGMKNHDGSYRFEPLSYAKRAEAAMMVYKMLERE